MAVCALCRAPPFLSLYETHLHVHASAGGGLVSAGGVGGVSVQKGWRREKGVGLYVEDGLCGNAFAAVSSD